MDIIGDIIKQKTSIHRNQSQFYYYFIRNDDIICRMQIFGVFAHNFIDELINRHDYCCCAVFCVIIGSDLLWRANLMHANEMETEKKIKTKRIDSEIGFEVRHSTNFCVSRHFRNDPMAEPSHTRHTTHTLCERYLIPVLVSHFHMTEISQLWQPKSIMALPKNSRSYSCVKKLK